MKRIEYRHGARIVDGGGTSFRLWAPSHPAVRVRTATGEDFPLRPEAGGWHGATLPLGAGSSYRYVFAADGKEMEVSDPASRAQEGDVHGRSLVVDHSAYRWRNDGWRGRPWHEAVIYELHVGLLGGYEGVEDKLADLAELGVTAIELMPVSDFPGARNWGYDGVLPFAPDAAYGTPDQLKHLIDSAHGLGLMVYLDVVYNHFGPDGNSLTAVAPEFFRDDAKTIWGSAIDFRRRPVRDFFTENAIQWIVDYRFDGLRFDAVHAIVPSDWLNEMTQAIRAAAGRDRHVHLMLENDANDVRHLQPDRGLFDAQWNDDAHHVLHVLLTGETDGYYVDCADDPAAHLARVLGEGFAYQGEPSAYRKNQPRGTPSAHLPPTAFVDCLQNHDQIGNRALGERLTSLADPKKLRAAIALLLLSPHIPLIFMGEEFGSCDPFLYFTSHTEELGKLIRRGRQAEFSRFVERQGKTIPDPNDPRTYERSRPMPEQQAATTRGVYRDLLSIRRLALVPGLAGAGNLGARRIGPQAVEAAWRLADGSQWTIAVNFAEPSVAWAGVPAKAELVHSTDLEMSSGRLPGCCTVAYRLPVRPDEPQAFAQGGVSGRGSASVFT